MGCDYGQHLIQEGLVDFERVSRSGYKHWEGLWSEFVCDSIGD